MTELPPSLPGSTSAPTPTPANQPSNLALLLHTGRGLWAKVRGENPRRALATTLAIAWALAWIVLNLLTRNWDQGNPAAYNAAKSTYTFWMWMFSVFALTTLIIVVWLRFKRVSVVRHILLPSGAALVIWLLVMHITIDWRYIHLIAIVLGTLIWWVVLCALPIWAVELDSSQVYIQLKFGHKPADFAFVMRPHLKVDQARLANLADAGISFDLMRLYLNAGAPAYMRDELSGALLGKYFGELTTLAANFPGYFRALSFKFEPFDVPFSQAQIQRAFKMFRDSAKGAVNALAIKEGQQPGLALQPEHVQARQGAVAARDAIEALYAHYKADVVELNNLFVDSDNPLLIPNTLHWVSAFDEWRKVWNKNTSVPVTVEMGEADGLRTRENLEFRMKVTCVCQYEPEKIRKPDARMAAYNFADEAAIKTMMQDKLTGFIKNRAHSYFQTRETRVVLETGADDFEKWLPEQFNPGQSQSMNLKIVSVSCDVIPPYHVQRTRLAEVGDEREITQLRRMLELGGMDPQRQAETLAQIMLLRYLPQNLTQVPRQMLPGGQLPQLPIQPPSLPSGEPITILPPDFIEPPVRKDDTQSRRRDHLNQLDPRDVIDLRPDEDDPDNFRSR